MNQETFMLTASGREYRLSGQFLLTENAPHLDDIAHHLALINRFTGATSRPYSVAEHSLLVERIGQARGAGSLTRLALLMHDAHEAYTNDLASPAKIAVGLRWHGFEIMHQTNVRHHFLLRTAFAAARHEITTCDLIALATERRDLMPFDPKRHGPWPILDTPGAQVPPCSTEYLSATEAPDWRDIRAAFVDRFRELQACVRREASDLMSVA